MPNDRHDHRGRFAPRGQGRTFAAVPDGWDAGTPDPDGHLGDMHPAVDAATYEALNDQASKATGGLPGNERTAVAVWVSTGYKGIRADIAGTGDPTPNTASFLDAMSHLPEVDGVFYRGVKGSGLGDRPVTPDGWREIVGSTIDVKAPSSASPRPDVALGYTDHTPGREPVMFQIRGAGRLVGGDSTCEVVIPAGKFRVAGVLDGKVGVSEVVDGAWVTRPLRGGETTVVRLEQVS